MRKSATALSEAARDTLDRIDVVTGAVGATVRLPEQLDRQVYVEVAEALKRVGFVWDKRAKVHVLDGRTSPADALAQLGVVQTTGVAPAKNPDAWYPTPPHIADLVAARAYQWCANKPRLVGTYVLEPSVGEGALLKALWRRNESWAMAIRHVQAIDIDADRLAYAARRLKGLLNLDTHCGDFLEWNLDSEYARQFDLVLMNPPFDNRAAVTHIRHAWSFVAPGGRLVAIAPGLAPSGALAKLCTEYRATIDPLPEGSFSDAGTDVYTCLLTIDNPEKEA
jgi:SAM-dependent methyltransferase